MTEAGGRGFFCLDLNIPFKTAAPIATVRTFPGNPSGFARRFDHSGHDALAFGAVAVAARR
jgi:hypothetical protein